MAWMDVEKIRSEALAGITREADRLTGILKGLHDKPETGLQEFESSAMIADYLAEKGFEVNRGIAGLPTAFSAVYGTGKPRVCLLAEYDALPELGHACGHNVIAAASAGAGVGSRQTADETGGSILVIGSPSEEFHSGKELLIRQGVFKEADMAMMMHPGNRDMLIVKTLACITLEVEYFGREAHASANPEDGINALDAVLIAFNAINSMRQHMPASTRVHGIITDGGQAPNVIPAHSAATLMVRASSDSDLEALKERVLDCFKGASLATGARLDYRWGPVYCKAMRNNRVMAEIFKENMLSLGREMEVGPGDFASTDMGNVSQIVPAIHPVIAICGEDISLHSRDFARASSSQQAISVMLQAAKAMALTITDIMARRELAGKIKDEFERSGQD